jgi:hypothetical protein
MRSEATTAELFSGAAPVGVVEVHRPDHFALYRDLSAGNVALTLDTGSQFPRFLRAPGRNQPRNGELETLIHFDHQCGQLPTSSIRRAKRTPPEWWTGR